MRIYYCGHIPGDAIDQLASVAKGKKRKRCGATAYNRCRCSGKHWDAWNQDNDPAKCEDHPEFLCNEHLALYDEEA